MTISKNLDKTTKERDEAKESAAHMEAAAMRDSLTGIRNRNAYDEEIKKLQWEIDSGSAEFGIGEIDLNFLKRINDTFGHDKGNIAIKNLCKIVCEVFKHSPVFRRADACMYENKKAMKALRGE